MPRVISVIEVQDLVGNGTDKDPARIVYRYFDFEGNLLASGRDPYQPLQDTPAPAPEDPPVAPV